jgi:hypothetical protein
MSKVRLADDLLLGARSISDWVGCSPRQIYYWARIKKFGLFRIGEKIAGRKSRILKEVAELEAAARAKKPGRRLRRGRGGRQRNRAQVQKRGAAANHEAA